MFSRIGMGLVVVMLALFAASSSLFAAGPDSNEPNDTPATATGPLVGDQIYNGSIASTADEDYFFLYTAGSGQYQVLIEDQSSNWSYCRKDFVALSATGDLMAYTSTYGAYGVYTGSQPAQGVLAFTTTSATKVYVRVAGERTAGCWSNGIDRYTLRAIPAGSISATLPTPPPAPPSAACVKAKQGVSRSRRGIKKLSKRLKASSGRKAKRVRKQLRGERRDLVRFRKQVKKYCA